MILNFMKNKDKSVTLKNADEITDLLAEKINAKNDEVMLLEQENEKLGYELNKLGEELRISESENKKWEEFGYKQAENLQSQVMKNKELNSELTRVKNNYDELSKKKNSKEQISKLKQVNDNQLKFIEILQTIASAKADKTQLKDVFSHNLSIYLDNNFNTVKQASEKLDINRTTLSELKSGKTALSYDNLDILDSKMCEYFECSVYELVTVKMEGKK